MTSDTVAALLPSASSSEAMNSVPALRGKNVIAAPVRVALSQSESAIPMDMGVALKGTTVRCRGSAAGGLPPVNNTVKLPHCVTGENVIESKLARTTGSPRARKMLARARGTKDISGPRERRCYSPGLERDMQKGGYEKEDATVGTHLAIMLFRAGRGIG